MKDGLCNICIYLLYLDKTPHTKDAAFFHKWSTELIMLIQAFEN